MEDFLSKVTQHAMNYAIRSGIGITASFAVSQTTRLIKTIGDRTDYHELHSLQERLDSKIRVGTLTAGQHSLLNFLTESLRSARGNTTLESAVTLTRALRWDIQSLGIRLESAANTEESRKSTERVKFLSVHKNEIQQIISDIKRLITRIEDAVPLINLAITTSGANLSTSLPPSVSPSRLLQASTFLTAGDTQYCITPGTSIQIGPTFTLTLYMLFTGYSYPISRDEDGLREAIWKEVIHKAKVKLMRSPINTLEMGKYKQKNDDKTHSKLSPVSIPDHSNSPLMAADEYQNEYSYHLEVIEDLDDNRIHSQEEAESQPGPYGGVSLAGIREIFPIYQIGKIFYADTGKILNIRSTEEANTPVLLLKRDLNAQPPRKMMEEDETHHWYETSERETHKTEEKVDSQDEIESQLQREILVGPLEKKYELSPVDKIAWRLPADLDPEWLAFEVYTEDEELDTEDEHDCNSAFSSDSSGPSDQTLRSKDLEDEVSCLKITPNPSPTSSPLKQISPIKTRSRSVASVTSLQSPFGLIRSSLSLLEMLIRLTSLQQFQQMSHLCIPDELLTFFLEESSTTGAGANDEERRRTRREARQKVGFDPYNESPIRRHGEEYQASSSYLKHYQGEALSRVNERHSGRFSQYKNRTSTPESWLFENRGINSSSSRNTPDTFPSSPLSSHRSEKKIHSPLNTLQKEQAIVFNKT